MVRSTNPRTSCRSAEQQPDEAQLGGARGVARRDPARAAPARQRAASSVRRAHRFRPGHRAGRTGGHRSAERRTPARRLRPGRSVLGSVPGSSRTASVFPDRRRGRAGRRHTARPQSSAARTRHVVDVRDDHHVRAVQIGVKPSGARPAAGAGRGPAGRAGRRRARPAPGPPRRPTLRRKSSSSAVTRPARSRMRWSAWVRSRVADQRPATRAARSPPAPARPTPPRPTPTDRRSARHRSPR